MPLYLLKCPKCDFEEDVFLKIADRDRFIHCASCSTAMERKLQAPHIRPEIEPYFSPNGKMIFSRAQRREDMKSSNAMEWEPGIDKDIARNLVHEKEKAFKPIEKAIDEKVAAMVVSGRLET